MTADGAATWTCSGCGETYVNPRFRDTCATDMNPLMQGDNWPPSVRHHWPSGLAASHREAWAMYAIALATAEADREAGA